jgi:outer membrane lipoprotein-sorting protein
MLRIQFTALLAVLVALVGFAGMAQDAGFLDLIKTTSDRLTSYSATIQMTQHQARGDSVIVFSFNFSPPNRMRIVYTSPASVDGQTMILNTNRFYTYIPSLSRRLWQDVAEGSNDQGEEMGFLYDFVTQNASTFITTAIVVEVYTDSESYTLAGSDTAIEVIKLVVETPDGRQVVKANHADAVPVAIDIYDGDDLIMEICVLDYVLNAEIDDSMFAIPEK